LSHGEDLARFNTVKKDLIVSKEEANTEALKGLSVTSTLNIGPLYISVCDIIQSYILVGSCSINKHRNLNM